MKIDRDKVQPGDRVTFKINGEKITRSVGFVSDIPLAAKILMIERPTTYGVVEEVKDDGLLTDEEKEYLKQISKISKRLKYLRICCDRNMMMFYDDLDDGWSLAISNLDFKFDSLKLDKFYLLEELGLGE